MGLNSEAQFLPGIIIHIEPFKSNNKSKSEKNSQGREIVVFKNTLLSF
jgi:hypothetical protein